MQGNPYAQHHQGAPQQMWGGPRPINPYQPPSPYGPSHPSQPPAFGGYPPPYQYGGQPVFPPPVPRRRRRKPLLPTVIGALAIFVFFGGLNTVQSLFEGSALVESAYKNESYSPPPTVLSPDPIPIPASSTIDVTLRSNSFYNQTVPVPVRCVIDDITPNSSTAKQWEAYLNELTGCLMRVWDTTVTNAGWTLPRPSVTVYTTEITTKCGKGKMQNAFYCSGDQQLYVASDVVTALPRDLRSHRLALDAILGHEFGHAIQGRTALLAAAYLREEEQQEREAAVTQRRLEVQADCLNGIFIHSIAQSRNVTRAEEEAVARVFYSFGDDVLSGNSNIWGNHGLGETRRDWTKKGLAAGGKVAVCNSFVVPDSQVR